MAMNLDEDSHVCLDSIGDEVLREILSAEAAGPDQSCDHCGEERACIKLGKLADIVDERYRELFEPSEEVPVFDRDSDKPHYEQSGDSPVNVIEALTGADYDICEDLEAILSEREEIEDLVQERSAHAGALLHAAQQALHCNSASIAPDNRLRRGGGRRRLGGFRSYRSPRIPSDHFS